MISDADIVLNLVPKCVNTSIKLHQRNMAQKLKAGLFFSDRLGRLRLKGRMERGDRMDEASLCIEDLMELKCSTIIEDSIQLIPFENTFAEAGEEEEILDPDGAFAKMRRSLVGTPLVTKDGRYACPHCNKTFSQKYIVPRHIRCEDASMVKLVT